MGFQLRLGGSVTVQWLKVLSDCIWREEAVPDDCHKQLLISLHKRASCLECNNYHGIALLSIPSKVFDTAILNCLKLWGAHRLREYQCGFCHGRSCEDHLYIYSQNPYGDGS